MTSAIPHEPVTQAPESAPLAYATPAARVASRGWAGAAVIFGGLCPIVLGGCFLLGVLMLVTRLDFNGNFGATPPPMTAPQGILMFVLYLLAFASFAGAVAMLVAGSRDPEAPGVRDGR
jgi:hypothetical protein